MKINYIQANKYVQVTHTTEDELIIIITGWGVKKEAMLRKGLLELTTEAKYARVQYLSRALEKYSSDDIIALAYSMLVEAQRVLNQNVPDEVIQAAIDRISADTKPVEAPKPPKVSKTQKEKNEIAAKIIAADTMEKIAMINSYGVFKCSKDMYGQLSVSTGLVLAFSNYKKCAKMAGKTYMKSIEFVTDITDENVFDLIDISIKTKKDGQAKLVAAQKERLGKKYTKKTDTKPQSFEEWYREADLPMQDKNGRWYDAEY